MRSAIKDPTPGPSAIRGDCHRNSPYCRECGEFGVGRRLAKWSVAVRLAKMKEHRACGIIRSLVEEEAAKVLILLDVVRCPKGERNGRTRALNSFYSHLAKRIYAEACSWRPSNFYDLEQYIDLERREYYLDGPNDVDWIFLYDAKAERERRMYVDYVQDVTEQDGERYWVFPTATTSGERHDEHDTPTCLCMVRALQSVAVRLAKHEGAPRMRNHSLTRRGRGREGAARRSKRSVIHHLRCPAKR